MFWLLCWNRSSPWQAHYCKDLQSTALCSRSVSQALAGDSPWGYTLSSLFHLRFHPASRLLEAVMSPASLVVWVPQLHLWITPPRLREGQGASVSRGRVTPPVQQRQEEVVQLWVHSHGLVLFEGLCFEMMELAYPCSLRMGSEVEWSRCSPVTEQEPQFALSECLPRWVNMNPIPYPMAQGNACPESFIHLVNSKLGKYFSVSWNSLRWLLKNCFLLWISATLWLFFFFLP